MSGYLAGGLMVAAGAAVLWLLRSARRLRAERVAEHGPVAVRGGLYRSRRAKGGRRG